MSFLKSKKGRTPVELVRATRDGFTALEKAGGNQKAIDKILEEISKNISGIKVTLYGDAEHEPVPEAIAQLTQEIFVIQLLPLLVQNLATCEFEARKDVAQIFHYMLRKDQDDHSICGDYIAQHPEILETLVEAFSNPDLSLTAGSILRECIGHESLARMLINSPSFYKFFTYVEVSNFDVASDAFTTLKDLLSKHKALSAEFLERNYDPVFEHYTNLLTSENYVTRRQSLKLLGELLLDRTNFNVMTRYISDVNNLKLMMTLLRDKSKNIQYEAFHVFKVFVANPNKPASVLDILLKNQSRLITFLSSFQNDKEDEQFRDEKAFLIRQIQQLVPAK